MKNKLNHKKIHEYNVVFQEETKGGYSAWVPDLPGCASQGETIEEVLNNIKEAIALYLEDNQEQDSKTDSHFKKQFVIPVQIYA